MKFKIIEYSRGDTEKYVQLNFGYARNISLSNSRTKWGRGIRLLARPTPLARRQVV